jgi:hypothetical protein
MWIHIFHILWMDRGMVLRSQRLAIHILPHTKYRNPNKERHLRAFAQFLS